MVDLTKVEQRREEAIKKAALSGDWAEVDNLLNQSYENSCRKDRSYGLCSLDSRTGDTGSLLDTIADDSDALSLLIKKEEIAIINDAIESLLSDRDREILFGVVFENKSFSHLAKEVGLSDKTVKRHYERIIEILRKELKNL
ncbi:sigma-70 family RNA polymerase sigma factor [Streptococcus constellatus]|uniref:sigma-70 family RNA polymerase sigma factor n=1 Tax=Streptococcus constellatus TaxID=76860 RepID=UPI001C596B40|nr:sigma-70 family RNA polymerase sigma factor [Streptococcus constellatus]MBW3452476.1 sigma-70 family RNA polymerase sigma factor [Streptococcus constellatus]